MQKNIVELHQLKNVDLSITINIEILILKEEIVQILLHKYYMKELSLRKHQYGIMIKAMQQDHGLMQINLLII